MIGCSIVTINDDYMRHTFCSSPPVRAFSSPNPLFVHFIRPHPPVCVFYWSRSLVSKLCLSPPCSCILFGPPGYLNTRILGQIHVLISYNIFRFIFFKYSYNLKTFLSTKVLTTLHKALSCYVPTVQYW